MALANVKAGNATDEFACHAMDELRRRTDNEETAHLLADLA